MSAAQTQLTGMIQAAHLNRDPSPRHDLNHSRRRNRRFEDDMDEIDIDEDDGEDIPLSVLVRPRDAPRHHRAQSFPPMPDLRFEESYLHSIAGAKTWWGVACITVRDQIMIPLAQGVLYNIALLGWQHWNRNARMSGSSAGARLRRWWYRVNKWPLPERAMAKMA